MFPNFPKQTNQHNAKSVTSWAQFCCKTCLLKLLYRGLGHKLMSPRKVTIQCESLWRTSSRWCRYWGNMTSKKSFQLSCLVTFQNIWTLSFFAAKRKLCVAAQSCERPMGKSFWIMHAPVFLGRTSQQINSDIVANQLIVIFVKYHLETATVCSQKKFLVTPVLERQDLLNTFNDFHWWVGSIW